MITHTSTGEYGATIFWKSENVRDNSGTIGEGLETWEIVR